MSKFRPPSDPAHRFLSGEGETAGTATEVPSRSGIEESQPRPPLFSSQYKNPVLPVAGPSPVETSKGRIWLPIASLIFAGASFLGVVLIALQLNEVKQSVQQSKAAAEAATKAANSAEAAAKAAESAVKIKEPTNAQPATKNKTAPQQRSNKAAKGSRGRRR